METDQSFAELFVALTQQMSGNDVSRATSPGTEWRETNGAMDGDPDPDQRRRKRTFPYASFMPYGVEENEVRQANLEEILTRLYVAIESGDFSPGALHWTRELRSWIGLKFDLSPRTRAKLARLYYELALAPGINPPVGDRFANMFMLLTKRKHYMRPGHDLVLDWRPLFKELKLYVLPQETGLINTSNLKRNIRTLTKLCTFSQLYFDPREVPAFLQTVLPYFTASFTEGAFVVVGLLNLLFPTAPAPADEIDLRPQQYLPTFFHLWSLISRSKALDINFLDLLSRLARDSLPAGHVPFTEFGIFTKDQSALIFTAILRLLEIPVGQATSPYSSTVDLLSGLGVLLDRDQRKHPVAHVIARWIVMSLSPACLSSPDSVLSQLEGLIQAVETFFHPSNSGSWTKTLAQLVYYLADFFVMRWNRERSEEMIVPDERRLTEPLKRRFVLCLRDVIFMGIYSKSGTAMSFSLSTLQNLAFLEPDLILPGALQRIYPSLQGLVEVHRTTSSLRSLQVLTKVMVRHKGYRCHVTTLLGLALPGIDANDLEKTLHTLSFIQAACYSIPFQDLTHGRDDVSGSALAAEFIGLEMDRMEREGANVEMKYGERADAAEENMVLRSSTAGFGEFLVSFLGKVFTLLENLPDASRVRSGSPEENIINTLPATLTPLFASLEPALYEMALGKIADFVANHVIHQAKDAMAFICNALCKVQPAKALKRLLPPLIQAIRSEIDDNGAASSRNTGVDVLPRDRALVWNISMLSMCVVHVGDAVLAYEDELFDLAGYMQERCTGIPAAHVSNCIHHLLLNLTTIYHMDYRLYEPAIIAQGLQIEQWGASPRPSELTIQWHVPNAAEIRFAVRLFESQARRALEQLESLIGPRSPVKRDGIGKEWSDEVVKNLVLLRLILSGVSVLFDARPPADARPDPPTAPGGPVPQRAHAEVPPDAGADRAEAESIADDADDEEPRLGFHYPAGYPLARTDPLYARVHELREQAGEVLHDVHRFLTQKQEDDVSCFNALYIAYRSWFIDVGMERSAHALDRVTRLLATDIQPYKISGLRKDYPRPLLVRRAHVYHMQRLRQNSSPRRRTALDEQLLLDLAASSVSLYTEIRKTAQGAGESAIKIIIGARPLVIPPLLTAFQLAVDTNDFPRIKGALFALLFGSLAKTIGRDWRFTPSLIRSFVEVSTADKPSVQKLAANGILAVMEFGKPSERLVILNEDVIHALAPPDAAADDQIARKRRRGKARREKTEAAKAQLALELVEITRTSHWKKASRAGTIMITLGMRFETIAPERMVDVLTAGAIDAHPSLRGLYSGSLVALFALIEMRALCEHSYENLLLDKQTLPGKVLIPTPADDPAWTDEFLAGFARPETEYYVDHDHPGWLVWDASMPVYRANIERGLQYDALETRIRSRIGGLLTRTWFATFFGYLKQEPRDASADRFRVTSAMLLVYALKLVLDGVAAASLPDVKAEVGAIFEEGSDKHQHRATAEILSALLTAVQDEPMGRRQPVWEYAFPFIRRVFSDLLTPENIGYWSTFLHVVVQGKDPRRAWPLVDWLASFRLDMTSNAAFKESSKIELLQQCVTDAGWHFQLAPPILRDFLAHLDHPYKGVREAMGHTLASLYRTRHHESYRDVAALMAAQRAASSVGTRPYPPSDAYAATIGDVFATLEGWRRARTPGQATPSSYTSGSKTVLLWLDTTLSSHECTLLLDFFPAIFVEPLLHMMDVKEDPELQSLAYHVFRHLPNIPYRVGDGRAFIDALIRIGQRSALWHQRLRILINIQVLYFRHLFVLSLADQLALYECVAAMLQDAQLEVRLGAATTLSGMIRCSPLSFRARMVQMLQAKFIHTLSTAPAPKRPRATGAGSGTGSGTGSGPGTPNPEQTKAVVTRHAAVLGLGALIHAFPYTSPPPPWLPEVLAVLAVKAAADPGMVGKSVKTILSDFKKTRQDTWHVDVKVFTSEQLEDLEGVLWKSYFA
ncbi:MAG: hypothetical protein M1826_005624 [Phylliscum demangeonii]|nr:MAG: hypothetical protein M1826_005624 [Phylliscum demangeonii]